MSTQCARIGFRRFLARMLALALVASGSVLLTPAPAPADVFNGSVAALYNGRNNGGLGESFIVRKNGSERFDVSGTAETGLTLYLQSPDSYRRTYHLQFAAPTGQALEVGTYADARFLTSRGAGQPGFQIGDQYDCPASVGRFEVLDVAPDLSHFWIVFEYRCNPGGGLPVASAAFGEIRHNMPMDNNLLSSASRLAFPAASFDEGERQVRIQLWNPIQDLVTVNGYSISGPGAAAFRGSGQCGQITKNSWCWIYVTYNPLVATPQQATLTIDTAGAGPITVDLSGPGLSAEDPVFARSVGADPDPVSSIQAAPSLNSVVLTWQNPRNVDFADTVVRIAAGTTPPATPSDGAEVYVGPGQGVEVTELEPGTPYSFAFFARDVEGRFAPGVSRTLSSAAITVQADRTALGYGQAVGLRGQLTDAVTGEPIQFADLRVLAYDPTRGEFLSVENIKAYAGGYYEVAFTPGQNYEYVVVYDGDSAHIGGVGGSPLVTVTMGLQIKPVKKFVQEGKPLQLLIAMDPVNAGQPVIIERQIKGKWKKYKTFKAGKKSPLKVSIMAKEGNYNFRATRAGDARHTKGTSNRVNMQVIGKPDP